MLYLKKNADLGVLTLQRSREASTSTREVPAVHLWYLAVCWLLWWSYTFHGNKPLYRVSLITNISSALQKVVP